MPIKGHLLHSNHGECATQKISPKFAPNFTTSLAWRPFRIFFPARGRRRGSPGRHEGGGGSVFIENPKSGRGGSPKMRRGGWPRGGRVGLEEKNNFKHKETWRDTSTSGLQPSRGRVPFQSVSPMAICGLHLNQVGTSWMSPDSPAPPPPDTSNADCLPNSFMCSLFIVFLLLIGAGKLRENHYLLLQGGCSSRGSFKAVP